MTALHNYIQTRQYMEKEHPGWLRALIPRTINAPGHYWTQKVLAISVINAAMMNVRFAKDLRRAPNPASVAIQSQIDKVECDLKVCRKGALSRWPHFNRFLLVSFGCPP